MIEFAEHEGEPVPGLPEGMPEEEQVLWQGKPDWQVLAVTAMHIRKVAAYFAVILGLRAVFQAGDGVPVADIAAGSVPFVLLAALALGFLTLLAWMNSRATMYTITSRRLVMRFGITLPISLNLPFARIDSADVRQLKSGHGDIALLPAKKDRLSWIVLWPHAKPWSFARVQPMLRAIPDVESAAAQLRTALAGSTVRARAPLAPAPSAAGAPVAASTDAATDEAPARRWSGLLRYPTAPLAAAVSLVVLSLVSVAWIQFVDRGADRPLVQEAIVASMELHFYDRPDGSVAVFDATDDTLVDVLDPGTSGFVRATMRGLARARKMAGAGQETPFLLQQTAEGRVLLIDPVTERVVDLWAFGASNARSIIQYLMPAALEERVSQQTAPVGGSGEVIAGNQIVEEQRP